MYSSIAYITYILIFTAEKFVVFWCSNHPATVHGLKIFQAETKENPPKTLVYNMYCDLVQIPVSALHLFLTGVYEKETNAMLFFPSSWPCLHHFWHRTWKIVFFFLYIPPLWIKCDRMHLRLTHSFPFSQIGGKSPLPQVLNGPL